MARAFGPSFEAIWHQRYDLTLESYLAALDLERLDETVSRHQRLDTATVTSLGVLNGRALQREVDRFEQALQRGPRAADEPKSFDIGPFLGFPGMPHYKGPKS